MQKEEIIYFNRKSRRGAIVFLCVFIIIAIIPRAYSLFLPESSRLVKVKEESVKKDEVEEIKSVTISDQKFNPNDLSAEEWTNYGFTKKQAQTIIKFKNQINGFKNSEDLKKSYVIDDEKFEELLPLLDFNEAKKKLANGNDSQIIDSSENDTKSVDEKDEEEIVENIEIDSLKGKKQLENLKILELNTATYDELISINGIGEYFAEKIIDERIKRGGFTKIEQLLDIYYFEEENLEKIKDYVKVDANKIEKFDLNFATVKRISRHPDITWEMARSIGDLRDELGRFNSVDQLLLSGHIDLRRYNKIKHYFKI